MGRLGEPVGVASEPGRPFPSPDIPSVWIKGTHTQPVEDAVATVVDAKWGETFDEWKSSRSETACRVFQGDSLSDPDPAEMYCQRCREVSDLGITEWSFYAYGDEDPPRCRLYEVRREIGIGRDPQSFDAAISARLGRVAETDRCATNEPGCFNFEWLHSWQRADIEVSTFKDRHGLFVQARSKPLREVRAMRSAGFDLSSRDAESLIVAELGERGTQVQRVLSQASTRAEVLGELKTWYGRSVEGTASERSLSALAAELLVRKYAHFDDADPAELPKEIKTSPGHAGGLVYEHDLLKRVLLEAPEASIAHELATLWTLEDGDGSGSCKDDEELYRPVVAQGRSFLAARPATKFRPEVEFALAQAYETWWSVSRAGPGDYHAKATRAADGADAARVHAVALYEKFAKSEPASARGRYARYVLPRLELGVDTNQRRYLCIHEC